jgi:hypothetical protein
MLVTIITKTPFALWSQIWRDYYRPVPDADTVLDSFDKPGHSSHLIESCQELEAGPGECRRRGRGRIMERMTQPGYNMCVYKYVTMKMPI